MSGIINKSFSKSKLVDIANDTCKCFCSFSLLDNTIHESFNVASVSDNGTGKGTVTFINSIQQNYVAVTSHNPDYTSGSITSVAGVRHEDSSSTAVRIHARRYNSYADNNYCEVAIFKNFS
tara:strand:+ start:349 stop:711 length:363 start_codon:yes stop_codon:yes gene_type:complete